MSRHDRWIRVPGELISMAWISTLALLAPQTTAAQEALHVAQNGNVGIGTVSPLGPLHVSFTNDEVFFENARDALNGATVNLMKSRGTLASPTAALAGDTAGTLRTLVYDGLAFQTVGNFRFGVESLTAGKYSGKFEVRLSDTQGVVQSRVTVDEAGRLGVGATSPARRLEVEDTSTSGAILRIENAVGTCDFTPESSGEPTMSCSSDARLKTNLRPVRTGEALADLMTIPLFEYELVGRPETTLTGPVAQELAKTHPDLVSEREDGTLMSALPGRGELIAAIQELQRMVVGLQARVEELEAHREAQ